MKYKYDKYGNVSKKSHKAPDATEYVPTYEDIADNTGTITRALDHTNNLQYDYTYDSTDRLISSTITDTSNNQHRAMFEYGFDLNNNLSKLSI